MTAYRVFRCMFDWSPNCIITNQDATICKIFCLVFRESGIDIACGMLGNMRWSIEGILLMVPELRSGLSEMDETKHPDRV